MAFATEALSRELARFEMACAIAPGVGSFTFAHSSRCVVVGVTGDYTGYVIRGASHPWEEWPSLTSELLMCTVDDESCARVGEWSPDFGASFWGTWLLEDCCPVFTWKEAEAEAEAEAEEVRVVTAVEEGGRREGGEKEKEERDAVEGVDVEDVVMVAAEVEKRGSCSGLSAAELLGVCPGAVWRWAVGVTPAVAHAEGRWLAEELLRPETRDAAAALLAPPGGASRGAVAALIAEYDAAVAAEMPWGMPVGELEVAWRRDGLAAWLGRGPRCPAMTSRLAGGHVGLRRLLLGGWAGLPEVYDLVGCEPPQTPPALFFGEAGGGRLLAAEWSSLFAPASRAELDGFLGTVAHTLSPSLLAVAVCLWRTCEAAALAHACSPAATPREFEMAVLDAQVALGITGDALPPNSLPCNPAVFTDVLGRLAVARGFDVYGPAWGSAALIAGFDVCRWRSAVWARPSFLLGVGE